MKPTKTKTGEILKYFLSGKSLTVKSCMALFGTHKLSARVSEFEEKYFVKFKRKLVKSKSRYGGVDSYLSYSLSNENISWIKKQLK